MKVKVVDGSIRVISDNEESLFEGIPKVLKRESSHGRFGYKIPVTPNNAYLVGVASRGQLEIDENSKKLLREEVKGFVRPVAKLTPDRRYVEITIPLIAEYKNVMKKVSAWPTKNPGHYRIPISRLMTLNGINQLFEKLPKIAFDRELRDFQTERIPGFDGSLDSLREIPIGQLNFIAANGQGYKALKKSNESLEEKFQVLGINTLYDLLFYFPRRYVDKTNPQSLAYLLIGESATILGRVTALRSIEKGLVIQVLTEAGDEVSTTFWRQGWLKQRFKTGDEVIITGKVTIYRNEKRLNGVSIDHADEAAILPIVPIYKQSETKGISTYLIMAALRELLDRLGNVSLPSYFKEEGRDQYGKILEEMHFPSSIEAKDDAMEIFAYYELVYMQLLLESQRREQATLKGLSTLPGERRLQSKTIEALPFDLTKGQKVAVERLNELLSEERATSSLLNAEVGAGKTIVAQLACIRAVEAGRQAILVGPTEILAKQLHKTFERVLETLEDVSGEKITLGFLSGSLKASEKRAILAGVKSGEIDILVGTHAVFSSTVEYHDLGLVCIDEQQKFGTEQRESLLSSRKDGRSPDILMQTATPIPRSIAQILYGDVEVLLLPDLPPGRLPIETTWIRENPEEVIREVGSTLWADIIAEAHKGHKTFVITPLVSESEKIDAASVESTVKTLQSHALSGLKIDSVHGKMKKDDQTKVMERFRDGELDVLVASTVVEVGVDIPEATRVVILSAERLGASSIWQIRGRVGRSELQSKCYLISEGSTESSQARLISIENAENGYEVAQNDLSLRGEGELFGSSQSGKSGMIVASLGRHADKIQEAKQEASDILNSSYAEIALREASSKFLKEED